MTERDRKLHRGNLLVQIEDTEDNLGFLRGTAISTAQAFERVAERLRRNALLEPSPLDFTAEGDVENRLTPDEAASFETVESVSTQIEKMKRARQDVFNLRKLRRA